MRHLILLHASFRRNVGKARVYRGRRRDDAEDDEEDRDPPVGSSSTTATTMITRVTPTLHAVWREYPVS